jgi:hypothetical protein
MSIRSLLGILLVACCVLSSRDTLHAAEFRAGAFAQPISPTKFPSPVNGSMKGNFAKSVNDHMHARCLALHDGQKELILCVVDACMIPREICEQAKQIASQKTGVPASQIMISATHTHSAATLAGVFQSDPDPEYVATVPGRIAQGLIRAHENLEPADVAWGSADDPTQVFNRRWYVKEGEQYTNPFGITTDRARMNPGYKNPQVTEPTGPVDPEVVILAVRAKSDRRPLAVLANYSLHYVGGNPPISADYYAAFAEELASRLDARDARYDNKPAFVGIMSNGTSGNINNVNYAADPPARRQQGEQIRTVARSVASAAMKAYEGLSFRPRVTLDSLESELMLKVRKPTAEELAKAKQLLETTPKDKDGQYSDRMAIYARESVLLADYPDHVPVKLQVHRIGDLSIATIPCEVFVEIGLELKKRTPFEQHFTVSLANGYNGYLPTEKHHELGGYETWRARSAYLETTAASKITSQLLSMLQQLDKRQQAAK